MSRHILSSGQRFCADISGTRIECAGTGQDAETTPGVVSGADRFRIDGETVLDTATGLMWLRDANAPGFPIAWQEAFDTIDNMNASELAGYGDWRLPDRRELFSLVSFDTHTPALPEDHPFENVFSGWYWTSTTSAMHPAQAWHVHLMGGRMFWGTKTGYELVWPVRGISEVLPAVNPGSPLGVPWTETRFRAEGDIVLDLLTGLTWTRSADMADGPTGWDGAFAAVNRLNSERHAGLADWRVPTIRELESLTDATAHSPALCPGHPFTDTREAYWSSTNSAYEPDWAMCYYLHKGAIGVGYKQDKGFHVWAVADSAPNPNPATDR
ncbi:DUF1566 domain-containing protein [Pseudodesulfovibrio sp.]|uniref:Lcl C-terminal domain-containing protein n=1 Tax=unclassified Pseudodesulfovibrio TaxID=2661612 RepID=UPI003AFFE530